MKKINVRHLGLSTYLLAMIFFSIFTYLEFIIIPDNENWEMFSYSIYGNISFYGLAIVLYIIISYIINLNKFNDYILLLILILLIELSTLIITQKSLVVSAYEEFLKEGNNYNIILYPILVIVFFFICRIILGLNLKKMSNRTDSSDL